MARSDESVVEVITSLADQMGLVMEHRSLGHNFRTVYLSADPKLEKGNQLELCKKAHEALVGKGVFAELTYFDNPRYKDNAGRVQEGHPRHGSPMVEIDSVWWNDEDRV